MSANTPTEKPVFTREYRNAVDAQWRVTVPSAWRFAEREVFYIRVKKDHLVVLPQVEQERFLAWSDTLSGAQREEVQEEWGKTTERVKIDGAGRLTLPSDWAKLVGIDIKKNAVLVGATVKFKIWDAAHYDVISGPRRAHAKILMEGYDG